MCKINKIGLFVGAVFLTGILNSCEAFNQDVKGFLQKYTETAAIEKMEINGNSVKSPSGITCLSSSEDVTMDFYLRNPQKYDLIFNYYFENAHIRDLVQTIPITYTKSFDRYSLQIKLPEQFLFEADKNYKNLSGKISITEPASGRNFDAYPITLHANSVPPKVENACFQFDSEIDGKYIICFCLPDVDSTQVREMEKHKNDTRKIYINNELRYFSHGKIFKNASCDDSGVWNFEEEDSDFLTVAPPLYASENGHVFKSADCPLGYTPVYYLTGIAQSLDTVSYSIKVVDDEGLSNTVEISNKTEEISAPFISNIAELHNGVAVDEDTGLYEIVISHDGKTVEGNDCGDVEISYSVYNIDDPSVPVKTGTEKGSAKIKLSKGKYKVTAKASKPYYITSAVYTSETQAPAPNGIFLKASSRIYVHQDGSDADGLGSKSNPFRTIQKAVDFFVGGVGTDYTLDDVCEVILMSNITPLGDEEYYLNEYAFVNLFGNFNYTIRGYNGIKYKIDACGNPAEESRRVIYNQSEKQVVLKDLIITGGYLTGVDKGAGYCDSSDSSEVIFDNVEITGNVCQKGAVAFDGNLQIDKAIIYDNKTSSGEQSNVYIAEDKKIKITKDISTSKIGITTEKVPLNARDSVEFTTGYGYSTLNTVLPGVVFISDSAYGISYDDLTGEAIVAVSGGNTALAVDKNMKINLTVPAFISGSAQTLVYKGDTVEFGVEEYAVDITDKCTLSYKVKMLGKEISPSYYSIDKNKLKFSDAMDIGTYTVKVTAVYGTGVNAVKSDTEFVFIVQEKDDLTLMSTVPASGSVLTVSTLASLNKLSAWVTAGNDLSGVTFILDKDIVLDDSFNAIGWVNGGDNDKSFCGTIDGNGHSIDITNKSTSLVCLITDAYNASVKNLVITGNVESPWSGMINGVRGTTIVENCINKADFIKTTSNTSGLIVNWLESGTVKNCKNYGNITIHGAFNFGVIVFKWRGGDIDSCENYGNISAASTGQTVTAGGIVGNSEIGAGGLRGAIKNCINYGTIDCPYTTSVGGIIGSLQYDKNIINCANYGDIKAKCDVGGIAGVIENNSSNRAQIWNCVSAGKIVVTSTFDGLKDRYGTIAGYQNNTSAASAVDTDYVYHLSGIILNSSGETLPAEAVKLRTPRDNVVSVAFSHSGSENKFYTQQMIFDNSPTDDLITALNNYVRHYSGEGFREWVIGSKGFPVLKEAE